MLSHFPSTRENIPLHPRSSRSARVRVLPRRRACSLLVGEETLCSAPGLHRPQKLHP